MSRCGLQWGGWVAVGVGVGVGGNGVRVGGWQWGEGRWQWGWVAVGWVGISGVTHPTDVSVPPVLAVPP